MELIIYGFGNRGKIIINAAVNSSVCIDGVIDSNVSKQGMTYQNHIIVSPEIIKEKDDASLCVSYYSSLLVDPIWSELVDNFHVKKENIYSFNEVMKIIYKDVDIPNICIADKKHKNLFVGNWTMKLGGVETWLRDIVKEYSTRGIDNTYLVTDKENSSYPLEIRDNVIDFSYEKTPIYSREYVENGVNFIVQNLPCTMIFSRVDELLLAASLVKKQYTNDLTIIMVDHGACDGMTRDIISYADSIDSYVAVSSGIKELLVNQGIESSDISVMTCPLIFDDSVKRTKSKVLRIGYAGRLEVFEKRMDILLKLISELEKIRIDYRLDIAGSGSYSNIIEDYIEQNHLISKINLLGQIDREKMGKFWSEHDIAINVSDNEGRGISNMEAMLYGAVPVVTETIGCLEDVEDGVNGYTVPICDYKTMAKKIKYLSEHRETLEEMSKKAQSTMLMKSSMEKHIELWTDILAM